MALWHIVERFLFNFLKKTHDPSKNLLFKQNFGINWVKRGQRRKKYTKISSGEKK